MQVNGLSEIVAENETSMTEENEALLRKLEHNPNMNMRDQRIILQNLYRNEYYFDEETWRRYQKMAQRFREMCHEIFPSMGS